MSIDNSGFSDFSNNNNPIFGSDIDLSKFNNLSAQDAMKDVIYELPSNMEYFKKFSLKCLGPIGKVIKILHFTGKIIWKCSTDKDYASVTKEKVKNVFNQVFVKSGKRKFYQVDRKNLIEKIKSGLVKGAKKVASVVANFFMSGGAVKLGAALMGAGVFFPPLAIVGGALFAVGLIGLVTSMSLIATSSEYTKHLPKDTVSKLKPMIDKWKDLKEEGDNKAYAKDVFFFAMDHTLCPFIGGLITAGIAEGASEIIELAKETIHIDFNLEEIFDFDFDKFDFNLDFDTPELPELPKLTENAKEDHSIRTLRRCEEFGDTNIEL